ncbi:MAG: 50S ribosomal protein L29 [Fibrobacteraceae bacterium]|nr:50S ribosomal protein L29 [Fibrobacteraceae bacterium]
MKARELKELSNEQLQEKLSQLTLDLFNNRFSAKTGNNVEKPVAMRSIRKDIARIKTILTERAKA